MNKFKILIIDDHLLVGHAWKTILEADPRMQVIDVVSGADAPLELIEKQAVDIVLLDINMKPKSGFCLLYTSPSPRDLSTSRMPSSA